LHTVLIAKSNTKGFELVINSGGEVDEFKKQY
jgi:hypothetical protein